MISKIEMTVDFVKAKSKIKKFQLEATNELLGDPAEIVKKRINEGKDWRGGELAELKPSTLNIRKMRGRPSRKPLIDTGKLVKSLKTVKKKNKTGLQFMKYGMHQAQGFVTANHFAVKRNKKIVGWRDYSDGRFVPPRDFINPEQPFAGMFELDKESLKKTIKVLKKVLRNKVTIK